MLQYFKYVKNDRNNTASFFIEDRTFIFTRSLVFDYEMQRVAIAIKLQYASN